MDALQQTQDLINSCFIPPSKLDLDEYPLQSEQFDGYKKSLELKLPLLFDLLQENMQFITTCKGESGYQILANLLALFCEISAPSTIYRLSNENFQRNVSRILKEQMPINNNYVEDLLLSFYKTKIGKPTWKKHLGSLHGLLQFLQLQFSGRPLPKRWVNFSLSVGLVVRDSHDPMCKGIGILIFNSILNLGDYDYIQKQNIHSVIYDSAYKDIDFTDTETTAKNVWKCVYRCLDFYKELESFNWSHLDDLTEKALTNVTIAQNNLLSLCNLRYVTKCGAYFAINKSEIEALCDEDLDNRRTIDRFRITCSANTSYTIFRWAKSVLNMIIENTHKLMLDKEMSRKFLLETHKCYLVFITPIQLEIIRPHLMRFLEKYILILMETIRKHTLDVGIIESITNFLKTIRNQLQHSSNSTESSNCNKIYEALEKLLKHDIFF